MNAFSATSLTLPDVTREFSSFDQAAQENAASRVYCGIHFRNSTLVGLHMGRTIASYVTAKALRPNPVHLPTGASVLVAERERVRPRPGPRSRGRSAHAAGRREPGRFERTGPR